MGRAEAVRDAPIVTIGTLWAPIVDGQALEGLLAWPPDVFALVDRALEASEAYRFVVSPPPGAELSGVGGGPGARAVARDWCAWLDGDVDAPPDAVQQWWKLLLVETDRSIDELAAGGAWEVIEALLALHAVSDEACAGLGSATASVPGPGCRFRARARELLAEAGTLATFSPGVLRVLPRCRAGLAGISIHSLSRHVFVSGPQVDVDWHRMLSRPTGVVAPEAHANVVLLPWPLRVRARDFRPAAYSLPHMDTTEFGFFTFEPEQTLDLDLVEGVLRAAEDEAGAVDVVMMPESAITDDDVEALEALLGAHGVWCLIAGVRGPATEHGLGENRVHVGVRQELVWRHATQHKHHRWCLDGRQLQQYHLGGALTPSMRWWEAMSVHRRSLQIIDQGAVTIAPLVCEDLARLEPVADLVRSIGPSLVMTLLLDGPQLASRWTARYASVLADDPGCAVCTLTAYGMVRRCRPPGCEPSSVIALWKDATGGLTEIALEDGADAVLIATSVRFSGSATADGRRHPASSTDLALVAVQSLRAPPVEAGTRPSPPPANGPLANLSESEVTKATSWTEAVAEAAVADPDSVPALIDEALACDWRTALRLPPPTRLFRRSIDLLRAELPAAATPAALLAAAERLRRSDEPAAVVTGTLVGIAVEQRLLAEVRAGRLPPEVLGPV